MCYAHWETCSSSILPPLPSFAKSIRITKTIPHTAAFASIIVDKRQKTGVMYSRDRWSMRKKLMSEWGQGPFCNFWCHNKYFHKKEFGRHYISAYFSKSVSLGQIAGTFLGMQSRKISEKDGGSVPNICTAHLCGVHHWHALPRAQGPPLL